MRVHTDRLTADLTRLRPAGTIIELTPHGSRRNLPSNEARRMDFFRWLMQQTPNS